MDVLLKILAFVVGLLLVLRTIFSAIKTFVLPRSAPSQLNRLVFGLLRRLLEKLMHFAPTFQQRDTIMAYYAPIGLLLLVPAWYCIIAFGYSLMYWSLGAGDWLFDLRLSGSSLLTLGFATAENGFANTLIFSEAVVGLILVAMLMAYLPTMYAAFSRREVAVSLLEVRAGSPPSAKQMLLRFHGIHGLARLNEYWRAWEIWFAEIEESHTVLPALVFFRSTRPENSWVTASGAIMDSAALTLSAVEIENDPSAALCIRAGFLALRRVCDYFDIPYPTDPHYPQDPISITRAEFDAVLDELETDGLPIKPDREQAWQDFAGWRVNYDRTLMALCALTMAPHAPWSGDRATPGKLPGLLLWKK